MQFFIIVGDAQVDVPSLNAIESLVLVLMGSDKGIEIGDPKAWIEQNLSVAPIFLSHESAKRMADNDVDWVLSQNFVDLRECNFGVDGEVGDYDVGLWHVLADAGCGGGFMA